MKAYRPVMAGLPTMLCSIWPKAFRSASHWATLAYTTAACSGPTWQYSSTTILPRYHQIFPDKMLISRLILERISTGCNQKRVYTVREWSTSFYEAPWFTRLLDLSATKTPATLSSLPPALHRTCWIALGLGRNPLPCNSPLPPKSRDDYLAALFSCCMVKPVIKLALHCFVGYVQARIFEAWGLQKKKNKAGYFCFDRV